MAVLYLIIVGAGVGFIATRLMRIELGIGETIAVGVLGAIVGGFVLRFLLSSLGALVGIVGAFLGAVALLWIYKSYFGPK